VPYETWIVPRIHEAYFERGAGKPGALRDLAAILRRTLCRILSIADGFHMVLHTSPNTIHRSETLGYWKTIEDDYHWHVEILPILGSKAKSYTFKEVYSSPVNPESAAARLREAPTEC
jgi:UDPglucose--hexose-1-phosphate uridylyltransferase